MKKKCGGFVVEVVNDSKPNIALVYPLYKLGKSTPVMGMHGWFHMKQDSNTAYWVLKHFLQDLDEEEPKFVIGEFVRAVQEGNRGFVGKVVAFEADGGVVCKSLNEKTPSRCRYTYQPKDLAKLEKSDNTAILAEDVHGQIYICILE